MKKIFTILGMLFALSANAQVTIDPPTPSMCEEDTTIFTAVVPGYNPDSLQYLWLQNGVIIGNTSSVMVSPPQGLYNITLNVILIADSTWVGNAFTSLTVNPSPTATASNSGPYCVNETISLTAGGGSSYSWAGPGSYTSSNQNPTIPNATLAMAGTYTVTVTDINGCSASATTSVVVHANPIPTITVSPNDTVCEGTPVELFATGGVSYSWSNGSMSQNTSVTPPVGTSVHSVLATDINGCSALEWSFITVNPTPTLTPLSSDVTCFGGSDGSVAVNASGGSSFSYLWSTGNTAPAEWALPAGDYSVTVTNNFGCSATDTAVVSQPLMPLTIDSLGVTHVSCFGANDGIIVVYASGGMGVYTYTWSNGGVGNSQTNLAPGSYTVTVTDGNSCTASATATVGQGNQLTATAVGSSLMCFGYNNGTASVTVTGGTEPYSYLWNNGSTTPNMYVLPAGTYSVTVTDANGCTTTASAVVSQPDPIIAMIENQTNVVCFNNNNGTITVGATGGTEPYSPLVEWDDGFVGGPVRTGLSPGTYTATITDANGCTASINTTITGPTSAITVQWYNQQNPCFGINNGGISVNAFGGTPPYTFVWENENLEGQVLTGLGPGNYLVTVIDANGCVAGSFGQVLQSNQEIVITTPNVINYCIGSGEVILATVFGGTQPYGQQWFDPQGNFFGTAEGIEPTMSGIWTLIISDGLGCTQTAYITVNLVTCDPTSVGELSLEEQIGLYPNPLSSGGNVVITLPTEYNDVTIQVMDITGKILLEERASGETHYLNTSGISSGTYIVQIASHNQLITKKLIVQ